jgi:outer membrane protein, heavy metal efflux system
MRPLTVIVGLAVTLGGAQEVATQVRAESLTLEAAVALALARNPTLQAKALETQALRANEVTAGLPPNPTASYSAEQLGGRSILPQHTVTLGQTIETGGKRRYRVESAQAATNVSKLEGVDLQRRVTFEVRKSFNDILVAQAILALAEENLRSLGEVERLQRFRVERGDIAELDLLRLQVQRFTFERDAADARQAGETARIALRAIVGPEVVAENVEVVGTLDYRDIPLDLEDLRQRAVAARPDLRAAEAARAKARADVNLARANAWWDFTPQLEYQRIDGNNTLGAGVSIPLRVFDRNQGEIARTQAEVGRLAALREAALAQALAEVDTAYATIRLQRDRVVVLRDTYLPKAERARQTVEFAYRRGGVSLLDFLDAQRTYRETALEHLRALGNFWLAVYQVEAAIGGPVEN